MYEIYEDSIYYYFVQEFLAGGEVLSQLSKDKPLTEKRIATIMHQLLLAINYCHKKNIVHRYMINSIFNELGILNYKT